MMLVKVHTCVRVSAAPSPNNNNSDAPTMHPNRRERRALSWELLVLLPLPHGELGDGIGMVGKLGTDDGVELALDLKVGKTVGVG